MKTIKCESCGNEISLKAQTCPKCGHPNARANQLTDGESLRVIIVMGLIVSALVGLGKLTAAPKSGTTKNPSPISSQKVTAPAETKSPDVVSSNKLKVSESEFMDELNAALKKMGLLARGKIELAGEYDNDPSVAFYFKQVESPDSARDVQLITDTIAQKMLDILIAHGHNPLKEWIVVTAYARRREKGAAGSDLVRRYGSTHYNFSNDQLEFELVTE